MTKLRGVMVAAIAVCGLMMGMPANAVELAPRAPSGYVQTSPDVRETSAVDVDVAVPSKDVDVAKAPVASEAGPMATGNSPRVVVPANERKGTAMGDKQTDERKAYEKIKGKGTTHPEVEESLRRQALMSEAPLVPNSAEWIAAGNRPDPYAGMQGSRSGRPSDDHGDHD